MYFRRNLQMHWTCHLDKVSAVMNHVATQILPVVQPNRLFAIITHRIHYTWSSTIKESLEWRIMWILFYRSSLKQNTWYIWCIWVHMDTFVKIQWVRNEKINVKTMSLWGKQISQWVRQVNRLTYPHQPITYFNVTNVKLKTFFSSCREIVFQITIYYWRLHIL